MSRGLLLCTALGTAMACVPASCEEDLRAQTGLPEVRLLLPNETLAAEEAKGTTELERGWKHRQCDRGALWLNPEDPDASLDVWGCGLVDPVSVYFVGGGEVLEIVDSLEPCPEPCLACPTRPAPPGSAQALETLVGRVELEVGDAVQVLQ